MINITNVFTPSGIAKLEVGQILIFNKDGKKTELKITKIKNGKVFADKIKTYSQDEIVVNSGTKIETISEHFGK